MKAEAPISFPSSFKLKEQSLEAVLGIINSDRGTFTCVGYAPSMRRRCRNPISCSDRSFVYGVLRLLELTAPNSYKYADLLDEAAYRSLCWRHGGQAENVAERWEDSIAASNIRSSKTTRGKEKYGGRTWNSQSTGTSYTNYRDAYVKTETDDMKYKWNAQYQSQARTEKEQKEAHEKKKNEQDRQEKEARERRQRQTQEREQQKQQEREKAVREKREWQQAWQNYVTKWAAFRAAKHESSCTIQQAQALIPWPVKSGRFGDLSAESVRCFYLTACPDAKTPAMFKVMRDENLKWHPDKMALLYHGCMPGDADKKVIEMLCRVVVQLRNEAREMRESA